MKRLLLALAVVLFGLAAAVLVLAQGGFGVDAFTVAGGGGFSGGSGWTLGGTIGQADAGRLAGGAYELSGGFWQEGLVAPEVTPTVTPTPGASPTPTSTPPAELEQDVYLPLVMVKNS